MVVVVETMEPCRRWRKGGGGGGGWGAGPSKVCTLAMIY